MEAENQPKTCNKAVAEPGSGSESSKQSFSATICSDISIISSTWKMMVIQTPVPSINMTSKYLFCSRNHLVHLNHLTIGTKIRSKRKEAALLVASASLKAQAAKADVKVSNSFHLGLKHVCYQYHHTMEIMKRSLFTVLKV